MMHFMSFYTSCHPIILVIIVIIVTKVIIMALMFRVVFEDRCVFKKWARAYSHRVVSCIDQLEIVINTAFQGLCTPNLK